MEPAELVVVENDCSWKEQMCWVVFREENGGTRRRRRFMTVEAINRHGAKFDIVDVSDVRNDNPIWDNNPVACSDRR